MLAVARALVLVSLATSAASQHKSNNTLLEAGGIKGRFQPNLNVSLGRLFIKDGQCDGRVNSSYYPKGCEHPSALSIYGQDLNNGMPFAVIQNSLKVSSMYREANGKNGKCAGRMYVHVLLDCGDKFVNTRRSLVPLEPRELPPAESLNLKLEELKDLPLVSE